MQAAMQNKGTSGQFGDMFNMRQAQNNPHMQSQVPQGGQPMQQQGGMLGHQMQMQPNQQQNFMKHQMMQQMPQQQFGRPGQMGMMGGQSWQPRGLQQAWGQMNNPQQFAQWQAQQQQALRSGQQGLIANHQQGIPAQQAAGQAMRPVIDSGMWDSPGYLG